MPNIFLITKHYKFKKQGIRTVGTVMESTPFTSGSDSIAYRQLIQYIVDGRNYYIEKSFYAQPLAIDEKVEVYYDERYPGNALITNPSGNSLPFFMIFFMLVITFFICVTLFLPLMPTGTTEPVIP
jgi:hypothetical protein